jgi:hypothetical protein
MKISKTVTSKIVFSLVMLFLLTPLTVFAQNDLLMMISGVSGNRPLKNVITVAKANGRFTDPVAAMNSLTDASPDNPYLVVIGPGVYTVTSPVVMKPHVDIVGSGENVTKIKGGLSTGDIATSAIIRGANYSTLSSLTAENTGGGSSYSIALVNSNASPRVSNVTARASSVGGLSSDGVRNYSSSPVMTNVTATASGGRSNHGVHNNDSFPAMTHVTATASGGTYNYGVDNFYSAPKMTDVIATASGGTDNYGVMNVNYSPPMNNVTATASGGTNNYGVYNHSQSSSLGMTNVTATATGGVVGYGIYNNSSSPVIRRSESFGTTVGLYQDGGTAKVSQSTIRNGVGGGGTKKCVACDDGSGNGLSAGCLPVI